MPRLLATGTVPNQSKEAYNSFKDSHKFFGVNL
jgi:hypothetical protein